MMLSGLGYKISGYPPVRVRSPGRSPSAACETALPPFPRDFPRVRRPTSSFHSHDVFRPPERCAPSFQKVPWMQKQPPARRRTASNSVYERRQLGARGVWVAPRYRWRLHPAVLLMTVCRRHSEGRAHELPARAIGLPVAPPWSVPGAHRASPLPPRCALRPGSLPSRTWKGAELTRG